MMKETRVKINVNYVKQREGSTTIKNSKNYPSIS